MKLYVFSLVAAFGAKLKADVACKGSKVAAWTCDDVTNNCDQHYYATDAGVNVQCGKTTNGQCLSMGPICTETTGGLPSSPAKNSWAPQKAGAKLSFEGVSTAWQKVKDGDEMTWEVMWQSKGSPNMDHSFIMGSNACGSMEAGIGITVRSTGELGGCSIVGGTWDNYVGLAPNVDMKVLDGKWHHIVVVFSRSQKTLKLYLDGAVAYDKTVIKTTNTDGDLGSDFAFGPGRRTYNGKAYEHDSRFARIALWSRALSGDEIKNCKDKCPTSDGLVALYTMDNTYDDAQGKYAALTNHDGAFSSDIYTTTDMCLWK